MTSNDDHYFIVLCHKRGPFDQEKLTSLEKRVTTQSERACRNGKVLLGLFRELIILFRFPRM